MFVEAPIRLIKVLPWSALVVHRFQNAVMGGVIVWAHATGTAAV
jgi:hypothetical protein